MLNRVTDRNMLSSTIIKHMRKNVFTNCLLYSQEYEAEIESGSLFVKEYPSDNLFMLKMRDDFAILYFYINDQSAFFNDMNDIKNEAKGKKLVTEIAYKEEYEIEILTSMFLEMNFNVSLNRVCLEKNSIGQASEVGLIDGIHLQNELINANNILSFLKENFNELTGCIPLINRIEKRIANNELLVIEEDFTRKTIGLLEYSSANKITIKHLAVSKEYRGKGIAKYLLNTLSSQNKPIITWTTSGSDAEKIYRNNGFMRTTYKSVVLLFEGE